MKYIKNSYTIDNKINTNKAIYSKSGNFLYCDNGFGGSQVGNHFYGNDGSTVSRIGNTYYFD